ncbi:hypothetical protein [Sporosarcina highlanderae]|uniref:Uncharacterized protein n=1 Tax=Sporosarcina highlanderae TaxID=3035916 RepID=A0ABT8JXF2_9BACL|nr:hypothetical protein [Sporosarcina highlanderae]MDN4609017.1 hypothetical protein [Sporosarcina highlanderae]
MDFRTNAIQTIFFPNVVHNPTNQRTSYYNTHEKRISPVKENYESPNDQDTSVNDNFHQNLADLHSRHQEFADLLTKTESEFSMRSIELLIDEKLQPILLDQKNKNEMYLSKLRDLEESIMQEFQPIKEQQSSLKEALETITEEQENKNNEIQGQLEQVKDETREALDLLSHHGSIVEQNSQPNDEQLSIIITQLKEKVLQHESIIRKEVQPLLKDLQEAMTNPLVILLKNLTPGTLIKQLNVNGVVFEVIYFLDFDSHSSLATFLIEGKIISIKATKIDSLTFG